MAKQSEPPTSFDRLIIEICDQIIRSTDGREMSLIEAALRREAVLALQGDGAAMNRLLKDYARASDRDAAHNRAAQEHLIRRREELTARFAACERAGLPPPDVLPHPAHVHMTDSGLFCTRGPETEEQRAAWEYLKQQMRYWSDTVANVRRYMKQYPDLPQDLLRKARAELECWRRKIPEGWNWKERIYSRGSSPDEIATFQEQLNAKFQKEYPDRWRRLQNGEAA